MDELFQVDRGPQIIEIRYTRINSLPISDVTILFENLELAIRESGKVLNSVGFSINVLPINEGSIRFRTILIGTALTFEILSNFNGVVELIQKFGAARVYKPDKEVLQEIKSMEIGKLCTNREFLESTKGIVGPLRESNTSVQISLNNEGIEVKCDNVDKFFEPLEEEEGIFPELTHGNEVELAGEMSRLNKSFNDIGFVYEGVPLKAIPLNPTQSVAQYHRFLEEPIVFIKAVVVRESMAEKPELRIISIHSPQGKLFNE